MTSVKWIQLQPALVNNISCTTCLSQKCKLRQNSKCENCDTSDEDIKHLTVIMSSVA